MFSQPRGWMEVSVAHTRYFHLLGLTGLSMAAVPKRNYHQVHVCPRTSPVADQVWVVGSTTPLAPRETCTNPEARGVLSIRVWKVAYRSA